MNKVFDALWRAAAYCFHPRLILLSALPVAVAGVAGFALAWFFWEPAVDAVRVALEQSPWLGPAAEWLNQMSGGAFRAVIGPLVVVALSVPVLLIVSMLLVSAFMGSAVVALVARRRFPGLERRYGGTWWQATLLMLGATVAAVLALLVSLPFWLIPPVALLVPPLIWGWLSYRVMSYDALAEHASAQERRELLREHRMPLYAIGLVTGYLGAAPSLVWATGVLALPVMPLLLPLFVWLYTLVFAFSALWFTHYALAALEARRRVTSGVVVDVLDPVALPPAAAAAPEAATSRP